MEIECYAKTLRDKVSRVKNEDFEKEQFGPL